MSVKISSSKKNQKSNKIIFFNENMITNELGKIVGIENTKNFKEFLSKET